MSEPVEEFTPDQDSATIRRKATPLTGLELRQAETPLLADSPTESRPVAPAPPAPGVATAERLRPLGIEGYDVGEEIGRGAQGIVYRAKARSGAEVALKVLRPEANEPEIERFERAVEAIKLLADVKGVVHVLDRGRTALGSPWYAMELVRGSSLRAVLDGGALDPRELVNVLVDAAYAIHDAHDRGIVHRDLKPENILLERDGERLVVKIADFGLARDIYQGATASSGGTPVYMTPEQVQGGEVTRRSDVHALGVLLYELVAGVPPFRHEALHELARAIAEERPRPPEMAWCGLPESLAEVILRALEKDPNARYPTAGAFAAEVERALRGETIGGVPLRPWRGRGGPLRRAAGRLAAALVARRSFFQGVLTGLLAGLVAGILARRFGWLGAPFDWLTQRW